MDVLELLPERELARIYLFLDLPQALYYLFGFALEYDAVLGEHGYVGDAPLYVLFVESLVVVDRRGEFLGDFVSIFFEPAPPGFLEHAMSPP